MFIRNKQFPHMYTQEMQLRKPFGVQFLLKDTSACRLKELGVKLMTVSPKGPNFPQLTQNTAKSLYRDSEVCF